jgi:hypothetical protein
MVTSEDMGQAIEKAAIENSYEGSRFDALRDEAKIYTAEQLNQKIMTPEWQSNKLTIMKPQLKTKMCYQVKKDENGNEVLYKGKPVVEEKEVQVFEGWKTEHIEMPGENLFKTDFNTAILNDTFVELVNRLANTRQTIMELSVATGDDHSYDVYKYDSVIGVILNASKSHYGKTLELLKTQISKGEQTNVIRQMLLQDQKRRGLFGALRSKLPF